MSGRQGTDCSAFIIFAPVSGSEPGRRDQPHAGTSRPSSSPVSQAGLILPFLFERPTYWVVLLVLVVVHLLCWKESKHLSAVFIKSKLSVLLGSFVFIKKCSVLSRAPDFFFNGRLFTVQLYLRVPGDHCQLRRGDVRFAMNEIPSKLWKSEERRTIRTFEFRTFLNLPLTEDEVKL